MSNESEILTVLKVLRHDARTRQARLDQLNSVIRMYESELSMPESSNGTDKSTATDLPPEINSSSPSEPEANNYDVGAKYPKFPKDQHLIYQIPYVLRQRKIATKMSILLKEINDALGGEVAVTEHQLRGNMNKLLGKGDLLRVKFNNSNVLVYYIFPEWVDPNENGDKVLKEEFMPSKKDMPTGYLSIEFI